MPERSANLFGTVFRLQNLARPEASGHPCFQPAGLGTEATIALALFTSSALGQHAPLHRGNLAFAFPGFSEVSKNIHSK